MWVSPGEDHESTVPAQNAPKETETKNSHSLYVLKICVFGYLNLCNIGLSVKKYFCFQLKDLLYKQQN